MPPASPRPAVADGRSLTGEEDSGFDIEDARATGVLQRSNGAGSATLPVAPAGPSAPQATVPMDVRGATSPAGMANRIPPRVDTDVAVTVTGWNPPYLPVEISVEGGGGGNGTVTVDGGASANVTANRTLKLRGVDQTRPGNGGNLKLVAKHGSNVIARSNGFSVSSIPQDWSCTFVSLVTGARRGIVVQDKWDSDSGVVADLDETEIAEEIEVTESTGCFAGVVGGTSSYLPGHRFTQDTHGTAVSIMTSEGRRVTQQTSKFKDKRSGANDIPLRNSGYTLTRIVTQTAPGRFEHEITKVGAATTANGVASAAGVGSINKRQAV